MHTGYRRWGVMSTAEYIKLPAISVEAFRGVNEFVHSEPDEHWRPMSAPKFN